MVQSPVNLAPINKYTVSHETIDSGLMMHYYFYSKIMITYTYYDQNKLNLNLLTLFPGQFLWHAKLHQKDWPSNEFPNGLFYNPCQPIVVHDDGSHVFWQYVDHGVYLHSTKTTSTSFTKILPNTQCWFCLYNNTSLNLRKLFQFTRD